MYDLHAENGKTVPEYVLQFNAKILVKLLVDI